MAVRGARSRWCIAERSLQVISRKPIHIVAAGLGVALAAASTAAELHVIAPVALTGVVSEKVGEPRFASGRVVRARWAGADAISRRLAGGERFDVVRTPEASLVCADCHATSG